jgi:hypothetical protein
LIRRLRPDSFRYLIAIQSWEPDIEQDHVGAPVRGDLDGLDTVVSLSDFVRVGFEQEGEHVG